MHAAWILLGLLGGSSSSSSSTSSRSLAERTGGTRKGTRLSLAELRELAARVGFPDPNLAAAIAMAESGGYPTIRGDGGDSIGLWQINVPAHPELSAAMLTDPAYNARAALAISRGGTNWAGPWHTTWTTGSYLPFLSGS